MRIAPRQASSFFNNDLPQLFGERYILPNSPPIIISFIQIAKEPETDAMSHVVDFETSPSLNT